MPQAPLPSDVLDFLRKPNPAVVATIRGDGSPHATPTWYMVEEDGSILLSASRGRARLRFLERDSRLALSVIDGGDWFRHVSMMGVVVRMAPDAGLADIDRLARHYTGRPYDRRDRPRVSVWMRIDSWHGWDPVRNDLWTPASTAA